MPITDPTLNTPFTTDLIGRWVCHLLGEALASTPQSSTPGAGAKAFDYIIVGGGSFGAVMASSLFSRKSGERILLLEAGPLVVTEHQQNLPLISADAAVWDNAIWTSNSPNEKHRKFPGLSVCIGGRSINWGGWSPYFIPSELSSPPWPKDVVRDLTEKVLNVERQPMSYLDEAAAQIGSDVPNDYVFGALHDALRDRLFGGLRDRVTISKTELLGQHGSAMTSSGDTAALLRELEAPLAVQSAPTRAGTFPVNKFSTVPLLIKACREAQGEMESKNPPPKKRLMAVPRVKLLKLERKGRQVTRLHLRNEIDASTHVLDCSGAKVFLGLGTIENTRFALDLFPGHKLIGRNFMAHLRSNVVCRVERPAFAELEGRKDLSVSALFVKGRHRFNDGSFGHFHVQITASGVSADTDTGSEVELWKKVPDAEFVNAHAQADDKWIVITLRGIGEMQGFLLDPKANDAQNRVAPGPTPTDGSVAKAVVSVEDGPDGSRNRQLWDAMDRACDELAAVFAGKGKIQFLPTQFSPGDAWQDKPPTTADRRDGLGTTHHEGGTLWMGEPGKSVTDGYGKLHETDNLYALGPCLLPTLGSPNPMLSGIALTRRTADYLLPRPKSAKLNLPV
jgi:hypothetical protein